MRQPYMVPVRCAVQASDGRLCSLEYNEHVHQPLPCRNGQDERHHEFAPPRYISVILAGQRRRIKVPA